MSESIDVTNEDIRSLEAKLADLDLSPAEQALFDGVINLARQVATDVTGFEKPAEPTMLSWVELGPSGVSRISNIDEVLNLKAKLGDDPLRAESR